MLDRNTQSNETEELEMHNKQTKLTRKQNKQEDREVWHSSEQASKRSHKINLWMMHDMCGMYLEEQPAAFDGAAQWTQVGSQHVYRHGRVREVSINCVQIQP